MILQCLARFITTIKTKTKSESGTPGGEKKIKFSVQKKPRRKHSQVVNTQVSQAEIPWFKLGLCLIFLFKKLFSSFFFLLPSPIFPYTTQTILCPTVRLYLGVVVDIVQPCPLCAATNRGSIAYHRGSFQMPQKMTRWQMPASLTQLSPWR